MGAKLFLTLLFAIHAAVAAEIREVVLKNNSRQKADVWINGEYQGWVPGGQTRYTVSHGLQPKHIEGNSDQNSTPSKYGGWKDQGRFAEVRIQLSTSHVDGSISIPVVGDSDGSVYLWFGSETAGGEPNTPEVKSKEPLLLGATPEMVIPATNKIVVESKGDVLATIVGDYRTRTSNRSVSVMSIRNDGTFTYRGMVDEMVGAEATGKVILSPDRTLKFVGGYTNFDDARWSGETPVKLIGERLVIPIPSTRFALSVSLKHKQ